VCTILKENSFSYSIETYRFVVKQNQTMFEQYIGDGASTFITIIAVLIGFATALGYIDFLKVRKEHKKDH